MHNETRADVLLAEPVGSCTDLSGTILQPLKERFRETFIPAPISVLADPERTYQVLEGKRPGMHRSTAYIIRKQFEEADRILINRITSYNVCYTKLLRCQLSIVIVGSPRFQAQCLLDHRNVV